MKARGLLRAFLLRQPRASKLSRFQISLLYIPGMFPDRTSPFLMKRIVIDDRSRLPGRFFGRFATSATSELECAA
jgi:hypothetical protein